MQETYLAMTGIVCVTLLLVVILLILGRLKKGQQQIIQKMLDRDHLTQEELVRLISPRSQPEQDFRRGVQLLGLSIAFGLIFMQIGGKGWLLAAIPASLGVIYLIFWRLNASKK